MAMKRDLAIMNRRYKTIKLIIELHNFFVMNFMSKRFSDVSSSLFDLNLLELKYDRFYLIESLDEVKGVSYENKIFEPRVSVRYHLRSQEARAYGDKHQAFFDRYLNTISFSYDDLSHPNTYKEDLLKEIAKREKEKVA